MHLEHWTGQGWRQTLTLVHAGGVNTGTGVRTTGALPLPANHPIDTMRAMLQTSWGAALLLLAGLASCGQDKGPQKVVDQYVAAIRTNRPDLAYDLLDEAVRRRVSKNEFSTRWRNARGELEDQARGLESAKTKPAVRATVTFGDGVTADLVFIKGEWRISEGITVKLQAATPTDALRAFVKAVEERDYQAVMQLVSKSMRETIEREISDRLERLKKSLDREIEVTGNKARFQYDRRYKIELIKEDGQWKILDFD